MMDHTALTAKQEVLARVFLGRLHVRFEKMQSSFALCQAASADDSNWIELQRQLHALGDAATNFGCDELGAQANGIALRIARLLAEPTRNPFDIEQIGQALQALYDED